MAPRRRTLALSVVALLLLASPLWLFPHEGDTRYTYERSRITVENGTLAYLEAGTSSYFYRRNSLNPVGCQAGDDEGARACAFDHHLVNHTPVTVQLPYNLGAYRTRPEFVRLGDAYYRRVHESGPSSAARDVTYDVERVTPQTVLAESAINVSVASMSVPRHGLEYRVAVTGETVTSFERLDGEDLGDVYRLDGTYYTVVVTDAETVSRGEILSVWIEFGRALFAFVGLLLLVGTLRSAFDARSGGT